MGIVAAAEEPFSPERRADHAANAPNTPEGSHNRMRVIGIARIARIALMVWMANTAAHGSGVRHKLTVCLQVRTVERLMIRPLAQELAARMFTGIGISLEWMAWGPACESSQAPVFIELSSGPPDGSSPDALAFALPNQSHITVFLDRIQSMECPAIVLAHVIAHEITHVVQGIARHSDTGVMKAHWDSKDMFAMRNRPLPFAREDVILLYIGLASREGGVPQ
jgi:hypothetical protein